jgi:hypothetical protein
MENFFTRVKDRTYKMSWDKGRWGDSYSGCFEGMMGIKNPYVYSRMTEDDRLQIEEAYNFAMRFLGMAPAAWNDHYCKTVDQLRHKLVELAEAWEVRHETEAQRRAKEWAEDNRAKEAAYAEEMAWETFEEQFDKVNEVPMYRRFADKVQSWLMAKTIAETAPAEEEKELVDAW